MNKSDLERDYFMLTGPLAKKGYDWWWHSLTAYNKETKEAKAFFIEYFVCNPALAEDKPTLGQDPENKRQKKRPSYCMIKVGCWGKDAKQIHNFYSMKEFSCPSDKLDIKVANCTLTETHMEGSCCVTEDEAREHPEYMCDAGNMSWNLDIDKQITFNVGYGASKLFRKLNSFEMFWHAEGIKTQYSGTIILDGIEYEVIPEKSYGYADKNWGGDFTSPWLWISSCNLTSLITGKKLNNSAFEAGGGRPKAFGIEIPRKLLIGFYHEGTMYEYNFARFWNMVKIDFDFKEGEEIHTWTVNASNKNSYMELVLHCRRDEMLLINYEAPTGLKLHNRLWNGGTGYGELKLYKKNGTLIDHVKLENTGCEYGEYC
ncbi:MAG: tocopherol cyclase family protein [Methanosphaera sp.]|nr:tocopherol cyclase family protein [Methanosphaera sp.]